LSHRARCTPPQRTDLVFASFLERTYPPRPGLSRGPCPTRKLGKDLLFAPPSWSFFFSPPTSVTCSFARWLPGLPAFFRLSLSPRCFGGFFPPMVQNRHSWSTFSPLHPNLSVFVSPISFSVLVNKVPPPIPYPSRLLFFLPPPFSDPFSQFVTPPPPGESNVPSRHYHSHSPVISSHLPIATSFLT